MKKITKYFVILLLAAVSINFAQNKDYSKEAGYVDFGDLSSLENGDAVTEVYIEGNLLRMVAKLAENEEPGLAAVINKLKLVKVNSFEVNEDNQDKIRDKMESINKRLEGKEWQRIVRRRASSELAYVYVKTGNADSFEGLVVLALDQPGEAAFVNIVGDIDLETIGKLTQRFSIPALGIINGKGDGGNDKENE